MHCLIFTFDGARTTSTPFAPRATPPADCHRPTGRQLGFLSIRRCWSEIVPFRSALRSRGAQSTAPRGETAGGKPPMLLEPIVHNYGRDLLANSRRRPPLRRRFFLLDRIGHFFAWKDHRRAFRAGFRWPAKPGSQTKSCFLAVDLGKKHFLLAARRCGFTATTTGGSRQFQLPQCTRDTVATWGAERIFRLTTAAKISWVKGA